VQHKMQQDGLYTVSRKTRPKCFS